jgi:ketosteroid isomerase-like protein
VSSDHVEALRGVYAEWAEGRFRAGAELLAPDVEFWADPERTLQRGPEEVAVYMAAFLQSFSEFCISAEDFEVRGDRVLVLQRQTGRSRATGMELDAATACIWTFRGDRVIRIEQVFRREDALELFA